MQWRPMSVSDLPAVAAIADVVHPDFPENPSVFAERLTLFPEGCLVLGLRTQIAAYMLSHPWRWAEPPPLNAALGRLPERPTTYYIHDIAILPHGQRRGHAGLALQSAVKDAERLGLPHLSLVSVNETMQFWKRHGFEERNDALRPNKLESYGANATFMVRPVGTSL
jgi:ribosomal protein S18 acetylase RimI-like enzyme